DQPDAAGIGSEVELQLLRLAHAAAGWSGGAERRGARRAVRGAGARGVGRVPTPLRRLLGTLHVEARVRDDAGRGVDARRPDATLPAQADGALGALRGGVAAGRRHGLAVASETDLPGLAVGRSRARREGRVDAAADAAGTREEVPLAGGRRA